MMAMRHLPGAAAPIILPAHNFFLESTDQ